MQNNVVGIITFHCSDNYGAMLQAYGLKEGLRKKGIKAEIIRYEPPFMTGRHWWIPYIPSGGISGMLIQGGYRWRANLRLGKAFFEKRYRNTEGKKTMQLYQFERIYSQMEKEFGKMRKGEEDAYAMLLLPLEGNALKAHREFPSSNSRRLREAIALVLFDIKERCTGEKADTGKFRNEDNEKLEKALLMAFDPYVVVKLFCNTCG